MRFGQITFLVVALLHLQACSAVASPVDTGKIEASSTNERAERKLIIDAVANAINSSDFAGLNRMADHYRTSRVRTPSGVWKLGVFHASLQYDLSEGLTRNEGCQYRKASFIRNWRAFDPNQPAAIITEADMLLARGWCIRGDDYARDVTEQGWSALRESAGAAFNVLDGNRAKASVDPEFYAVMADVYRAQGRSRSEFEDMLEEGTTREPYYHRTYFKASPSYLPQWGGSWEELDQFARRAAAKTRSSDKTAIYVRIYWFLDDCGCSSPVRAGHWDDIKQSMRDLHERYPVPFNADNMVDVSCEQGDEDEALHYMHALHPDWTSDVNFTALMEGCRMQKGQHARPTAG